jgi:ATP-dependent exoDNAse (exonuclease V) alpha subunit
MGNFTTIRPLEQTQGWRIEEVSSSFDTALNRKFQRLKQPEATKEQDNTVLPETSFLWSQEREEIFNQLLNVDSKQGEFIKRANVSQLNDQLRKKISSVFEKHGFGSLNRYNGFFVYHPKGNKTIMVLPRTNPTRMVYFLLTGLALCSVPLNYITKLVGIYTYNPEGVFMEEKILEKDEYEKTVSALIAELQKSLT